MRNTVMYALLVVEGMMVLFRFKRSESSIVPAGAQTASLPSNLKGSETCALAKVKEDVDSASAFLPR